MLHTHTHFWIFKLNRPEVYNALDAHLIYQIREVAEKAQADDKVRALIITGEGNASCSGADLKSGISDPDLGKVLRATYNPMVMALRNLPIPVIGAINGPAAGAGCSLALACDYLVAKDSAYFSELFIQIGLVPDAGSMSFLVQSLGYHKAFELASTGRKVSASEAKELGIVSEVISDENWENRLLEIGKEWSEKPTQAIGLIKKGLQKAQIQNLEQTLETEADLQSEAGFSKDFAEGVRAFLEKRKPSFNC